MTIIKTPVHTDSSSCSNRILVLAIVAILFLTLYPFRFDFGRHLSRPLFPLSLGGWGKGIGPFDNLLNILLFVPFGFGLAEKFRTRGKSWVATLGFCLAAGALLSYAVEFLQIYIPQRDSGWEDIFTNSFGAVIGGILFKLCGRVTSRLLTSIEQRVNIWLIWQRAVLLLLLYIAVWSGIAVGLQKEARLNNWDSDALLVVGNSASNRFTSAWKGRVFELEVWDRAVSAEVAPKLMSQHLPDPPVDDSIVEYRVLGSPPFQDEHYFLPDLSWAPETLVSSSPHGAFFGGTSWLITPGAVTTLVSDLEKTGQFSLRVLCEPAVISGVDAPIVSISSPSGVANMELRQQDAALVFWFRTPLSMQPARMSWIIPETFAANEMRDILLSFDGTNVGLFIDGKKYGGSYELGPGAALARLIRRIKTPELEGYKYVFYALVFFPTGCLIGLAWRTMPARGMGRIPLLLLGLVLPAVIFEAVLLHVSDRAVSTEDISLSILLAATGSLWISADRILRARYEVRRR